MPNYNAIADNRQKRQDAIRMYRAGSPLSVIKKKVGGGHETIKRWLKEAGIQMGTRGRRPAGGSWEFQREEARKSRTVEEFHERVGKAPTPDLTASERAHGIVIGGGK